ncbi:hypothetical protein [Streptomyces sp. NPDC057740]|uniref:hypothetical protein n=1 Tax=Streptomyces sp. NPDC057740 TaxID=3346234 RepID=UPI0036A7AEB1
MLRRIWTTTTPGRRRALIGASTAVVCVGGMLAACGGGGSGDGYVATGAAGGPPRVSASAGAPTGEVTLVPLDGTESDGPSGDGGPSDSPGRRGGQASASPASPGAGHPPARPPSGPGSAATATGSAARPGSPPEPPAPSTPSDTPDAPAPSTPATPAKLTVSTPVREPTDQRWCEKVTLGFRNSGGTAVRSGTVTFGTHVIGALGIDWATVESTEKLPAPIGAGKREELTWTVCVDAWRVPLGMHIETRDVTVRWE